MTTKPFAKQIVRKIPVALLLAAFSVFISNSTAILADPPPAESQARLDMLTIAERYADHRWTATANNLWHPDLSYSDRYTLDNLGVSHPIDNTAAGWIDTPDADHGG